MPLIHTSSYQPPLGMHGGHRQTIYPTLFRKLPPVPQTRERIATEDGDFIDLDWTHSKHSKKLAILTHGLEGSSRGIYIRGMARALAKDGFDVLAWNFRGCSGEPNHRLQSYHSGATHDLKAVIAHAEQTQQYDVIVLLGFSLGGNLTLKFLGDEGSQLSPRIKGSVNFSVATDLASSAKHLENSSNRIYMRRFMNTLRDKVREKIQRFPGQISDEGLDQMRTFREFDDTYTAPIHGFRDAADYWKQCSCENVLQQLEVPTLLINAVDDPFLTPDCYPREIAAKHPHFHLEIPKSGGHMGFIQFNAEKEYWSESRARAFLHNIL
ncbi:MAG: alpha/beta fold hydrolase [Opitutales bacterium]|nr:alpha/beta fold hydrolase [Opitutales bacterium]MDP4645266.1 alpha/beta fold hydrolase [Opitutales bacterium]MDP4694545.1 alpha/beta fold hydrolase [Opitutales bacterium]MDP4883610.1 alpha/beta fold hydrolase [Opitutales bacterium]MDP5080877.1 alpha/beta fold hydrolase [Opitutales bacterium]